MKAPKKLYLLKRCKLPYDVVKDEWYEQPPLSLYGCIKYTRTDAFIKRAEQYLYKMLSEGRMECGDMAKLIDGFKEYMEGE